MARRDVSLAFFEIPGKLPGLNDIIGAARTHYHAAASQKKKAQKVVIEAARRAGLDEVRLKGPTRVEITWVEPNKRRDVDNICAGVKFILDALVEFGVLENDDQKHIVSIEHHILCDRGNPHVAVWLKGVR